MPPADRRAHRPILPSPAASTDSDFEPTTPRRGRKPGPLSRAARESQRKLNHSIIEKARRTKINDALTSLKHLVPAGYGQPPSQPGDDDEEAGKKKEKEKEFKLEILERTVVFLQDLLKRVEILEADAPICANCTSTRKRSLSADSPPSPKRPRTSPRLPPISSWLHEPQIDPQLLNLTHGHVRPPQTGLPSPPASTHFTPQHHPLLASSVPTLHLGASASAAGKPSPPASALRTPEDESAASLLLQISASGSGAGSPSVQAQTPGSMLGLRRA